MKENFPNWLTKQMVNGVRGFNLDAYLVALEGWRRGLTLTWYSDAADVTDLKITGFNPLGKTFSLGSGEKTHYFYRSRGDKVANEAVDIGTNKGLTKEILIDAGIKVPEGESFNELASNKEIYDAAINLSFPLVVKPTFGSLGNGVVTNIRTEKTLKEAIEYVRLDLGFQDLIIERYTPGDDLRIYVVEDTVVGAINRVKAHVVGDGVNTIENIINKKNALRSENPYLLKKLILFDDDLLSCLREQGYNLQSVLSNNEKVYIKSKSNLTSGGDSVDITDTIQPEVKDLAIKAVRSITGLKHAAVDLLFDGKDAVVLEINTTAGISLHVFPSIGQPRNVPAGIIDYYFPETRGSAIDRTKIFFDYKEINELQQTMLMKEIQLTNAPLGKLYAKRFVISGQVQKVNYRNWIKREARRQNLNGYVRNLRNGKVVVVVGSDDEKKVDSFKDICFRGPYRAKVVDVQEYIWDNQVKIGFEIKETNRKAKRSRVRRKNMGTPGKETVSITAVGDILLHGRVYGGLNKKKNYEFSRQLENVKDLLGKTDITVANLESIIAGNEIGLSSFPKFNAPVEIGYTLKDMGVDIVTIANNHVLDRGEEGLLKSIENLEEIGLEYDGAYKSFEDRDRLRIIEKNGLKICFLSYTSGTNGIKIPQGKPYLVNSLRTMSLVNIRREMRRIKRENLADAIIVNLHFGKEYSLKPSSSQRELAAELSDSGADVILGHHPHVLQPPEWIENSHGMKTFVAYSLGNFFSGQDGLYRQIGTTLSLEITKPNESYKGIVIKNPKFNLTYVNREERLRYDMYLFKAWIKDNKYIDTINGKFLSEKVYEDVKNRLRAEINDLEIE